MKFWIFSALHAKSLILRKVPVKNVHLHGFHPIDIPADDIEWNEMAGGIDHEAAPRKTRLVLNLKRGCGKTAGGDIHQLEKGLETVHCPERRWGRKFRALSGHFQNVALVLADLLDFLAGVPGLNHKCCF